MPFTLYWISADGQASMPMGEYPSREAAEAAEPAALEELLAQCGEESQRADIRAGSFSVDAPTPEEAVQEYVLAAWAGEDGAALDDTSHLDIDEITEATLSHYSQHCAQAQVGDWIITEAPSGAWEIVRVSDGAVKSLAAGIGTHKL